MHDLVLILIVVFLDYTKILHYTKIVFVLTYPIKYCKIHAHLECLRPKMDALGDV